MRQLRGLGALLVLVTALVGVPYALVRLAGPPWPTAGISTLWLTLLRPDDGRLLVGLIATVGWLAWAVFVVAVLAELINLARNRGVRVPAGDRTTRVGRTLRLPGLGASQQLAGLLLFTVVAAVVAPVLTRSAAVAAPPPPTPDGPAPTAAALPEEARAPLGAAAPTARVPKGHLHTVAAGDDLWTLAERFYGQGREWRRIAAANPDVLTGGPDRLVVGARLAIPGVAAAPSGDHRRVVVHRGDSLTSLAERVYGDGARWRDIFEANRHLIADPDAIEAGTVLGLPADRRPAAPDRDPNRESSSDRDQDESTEPRPPSTTPASPIPSAPVTDVPSASPSTSASPTSAPSAQAPTAQAPSATSSAAATAAGAEDQASVAPPPAPAEPGTPEGPTAPTTEIAVAPVLAGVSGLLAAGLLGSLLLRRRGQLSRRPVGRRILHPSPAAQQLESALGVRQRPLGRATLDLVLRAVAWHCHHTARDLPVVLAVRLSAAEVELVLRTPDDEPPLGFFARGRRWVVSAADADYFTGLDGIEAAPRAYPTLVTVGLDDGGREVLVDLEQAGEFGCAGFGTPDIAALVAALAIELATAPWAEELFVTLVGTDDGLPAAADRHNLTVADDVGALLDRLEGRAAVQRRHLGERTARQQRIDPELSDPWAPEVVLVAGDLDPGHRERLRALVSAEPRTTTAVVWAVTTETLHTGLVACPDAPTLAELRPLGWTVTPHRLEVPAQRGVQELLAVTGSEATTPAPWWDVVVDRSRPTAVPPLSPTSPSRRDGVATLPTRPEDAHPLRPDQPPPDDAHSHHPAPPPGVGPPEGWPANVTVLVPEPRRAWASEEDAAVARLRAEPTGPVHHPTVLLLGPLDLVGTAGIEPARAARQCVEYCAWLLEHPGATAPAMVDALAIAEGTRRSNVSRLRAWLGEGADGEPYLPDAYSGRIVLDPAVSSDWQRFQVLTATGINRTSTEGLLAALELVRGAPLADAAPGQWHWAEELRTDMASAVRDLGVELTDRALSDGDVDLARWAAARALVAAPEDEQLLCARIRTEHRAGHASEVERLSRRIAAQARALGTDLDPDTVSLLQRVMEGRVRARSG